MVPRSASVRIGLIYKMTSDQALNDVVLDIARTIADNAPLSVAASKLTINELIKDESQRNMEAVRMIGENFARLAKWCAIARER